MRIASSSRLTTELFEPYKPRDSEGLDIGLAVMSGRWKKKTAIRSSDKARRSARKYPRSGVYMRWG